VAISRGGSRYKSRSNARSGRRWFSKRPTGSITVSHAWHAADAVVSRLINQLDRHVGALVVRILADPRHTEAIEAAAKATQDKRRPLRAELTECEHLADELSGRLGRREITLQRYDVAMAPLDKRIAELHAELAELGTACRQQPRTRPPRPRPARNGRRDGTLPR